MNVKRIFIFFIILLIGVSIVGASDTNESNNSDDSNIISTIQDSTLNDNNDDNKLSKELTSNSSVKKDSKTVILNSTNFDDYVSEGKFNDEISEGDTIDIQGMLDSTHFGLTVDKPLNIISSTHDAYIGADSPMGFTIVTSGSGTNITGIHFNNTHFVVKTAHNININNITVETSGNLVGSNQGVTSIREDSTNITINNSYFKSNNNLGVSTLVCAVAQNVLIENCTIEAIGFCGNLVYFTTYNVAYDSSRGYGNRNITFRNNHIIGLEAIQQSICYGLTMEGIGHTIENNLIEYDYYCLQQQANLDNADEVDQIIIRNNTIPYGTNNIAFAQVENNTFNNIEHLGNSNFTNNIVHDMNITGNGNYYNNSINTLTVKSNDANITNNTVANYVSLEGNNNTLQDNSFNLLINNGENNTVDNLADVSVLNNYVVINNENFRDYGSRTNGILTINNIPNNTYVYVDGPMLYTYVNRVVINVTGNNIYFNINSSVINNVTVNTPNITITNTVMPKAGIYATENTKLVNSLFLTTDTEDKFIMNNSTIYSTIDKYIVFDSRDYDNIFDANTNTLLDNVTEDSIIVIRNKTSDNVGNDYTLPIILNKKVSIISFENTTFNADITFTDASEGSNINNVIINKTLKIQADNITIKDNKIDQLTLKNSDNVLVDSNIINKTVTLENSNNNIIINNNINTNDTYTLELDATSINNNITNNYLKSESEYADNSINADFNKNNIYDNLPELFATTITINAPSKAVLNTPTQVNITVNYDKGPVTNGYVIILANGVQKDKVDLIDGVAATNITFTYDGTNTLKVRYYSEELYTSSTALKNITANKLNTNLQFINLESVKVGENLTVTLNVTDENNVNIPDGNITLTIRDDTYIAQINDGIATTNIIIRESYMSSQLTAYYDGTSTNYGKTLSTTLNIQKGDAVVTLLPVESEGSSITLTAYITDINGNPLAGSARVRFEGPDIERSGLLTVSDAKASHTTPKPASDFTVNVTFRNSNAFENTVKEFTVPINGPKNITITLNAENTKIGEELTLTANVIDEDNNPVNDEGIFFNIAGNAYRSTVTDGVATYKVTTDESFYAVDITATFDANYRYNEATSNAVQLEKGEIIITLTQEEVDDKIIITATVTDINNKTVTIGNVVFNQDEMELINSQATYEMSSNIIEDITVNATFTNNPAFNDNTQQIIIKSKPLELKMDTTTFVAGTNNTISASFYRGANMASDVNGGKVVFKVNGKTLKDSNGKVIYAKVVNGVASVDYEIPDTWTNTTNIQAVYSGSTQYASLKTQKEQITVTKSQVSLSFADITAKISDDVQITIQVKQADNNINTGKVVVKLNGKTLKDTNGKVIYAQVANGVAVVNYTIPSNLKVNDYTLTAVFISNEYDRVESNQTLTITN